MKKFYLLLFSFLVFNFGINKCIASDYFDVDFMSKDGFSAYYIFSKEDLSIIHNGLTSYYSFDDTIKIAFANNYWYSNNFDGENYYIFVYNFKKFSFFPNSSYTSCSFSRDGYCHWFTLFDTSTKFSALDIFSFNLKTKTFNKTNLFYTDVISKNFYDYNLSNAYYWLFYKNSGSYDDKIFCYLPLWIKGDLSRLKILSFNVYDVYNFRFSSNLIFPDYMTRHYNIYDYFVGENATLHSYIDYYFGTRDLSYLEYKVNYYFNDVLDENLSYSGYDFASKSVSVSPDKFIKNYVLKNDGNYSIVLTKDTDNVINIYYVSSPNIITSSDNFYLFIRFEDLNNFFPHIDFSIFSQSEQFLILLVLNIFYLLFWAFIIWIVVKMLYKFFQWI